MRELGEITLDGERHTVTDCKSRIWDYLSDSYVEYAVLAGPQKDFDGENILLHESVGKAGRIRASGNIIIAGDIEAANLQANGSLTAYGSVRVTGIGMVSALKHITVLGDLTCDSIVLAVGDINVGGRLKALHVMSGAGVINAKEKETTRSFSGIDITALERLSTLLKENTGK